MIQNLIKGQKAELGKIREPFDVFIKMDHEISTSIDLMIWMMDEKNQVNKNNIIFYNQPYSICKSIFYDEDERKFKMHMDQIDEKIKKMVCGVTIYEDVRENRELEFSLEIQKNERSFHIHQSINTKECKNVIVGEIYLYKDLWKWNTIFYESEKEIVSCMKKIYDVHILE
ncbi:TerD family protein [Inediibacterium massiliense]|uniref:TerD family protein n=1 Tax=Inediibacterium massiliense TaxID=1658111 RepID=UPI0006B4CD4E|nr:TerD family protein [Inediibacterium massiliense]